jgi:hypothetical protein
MPSSRLALCMIREDGGIFPNAGYLSAQVNASVHFWPKIYTFSYTYAEMYELYRPLAI